MRCLCKDGEATLCEDLGEGSCSLLNPTPVYDMNCIVRGTTLANGQSMAVSLNIKPEKFVLHHFVPTKLHQQSCT